MRRCAFMELLEWFVVEWDEKEVRLQASPPGGNPWKQSFQWKSITRICYKAEGLEASDGVYVFTSDRPESYAIPVEAAGGSAFWEEILRRGLFDARLAIQAALSPEGLFCWPGEQ
jgi:hypothetical protein